MADIKQLLKLKKTLNKKRPKFKREGYRTRKRLGDEWRKPRGRHSKMRHGFAGHRKKVMPGFRTNNLVRGLHSSGLIPVVIHSLKHVSLLNKNSHGAIIGSSVGNKKRLLLIETLKKQGISILNLKESHNQKIQEEFKKRKELKEDGIKKKESKKIKKVEKGEAPKELSPEEKEAQEKIEKDKLLTKAQK